MRTRILTAAMVFALLAGCAGGGGGGAGDAMQVSLVPRMTQGEGSVSFVPRGDTVEVRVRAAELPEPYAYTLHGILPGDASRPLWQARHVWEVATPGGRADYVVSVPRDELARWQGLELVHLPRQRGVAAEQSHPALVASIPTALRN